MDDNEKIIEFINKIKPTRLVIDDKFIDRSRVSVFCSGVRHTLFSYQHYVVILKRNKDMFYIEVTNCIYQLIIDKFQINIINLPMVVNEAIKNKSDEIVKEFIHQFEVEIRKEFTESLRKLIKNCKLFRYEPEDLIHIFNESVIESVHDD
ncbi:MAG: hypothetical protein KDH96_09250 [Candidatus Riesia sp.]|nr:hypothetical protein [Candidatus Riesia sp.]